jgi:hypothetical protein
MTIQQHASFDSSAAELNATSKLVKAWESKNAKNAAKAGGISMMALSLAACGGSDSTTTAVVADPVTPVTPVNSTMSVGVDTITGTSGADTFSGTAGGTTPTLTAGDSLTGGDGADMVLMVATGTANVNVAGVQLNSVETVRVADSTTGGNTVVNLAGQSGFTDLESFGSAQTGDLSFTNVASIADLNLSNTSGGGTTEISYTTAAVAGTSDVQNVALATATQTGDVTIAGVETVAVTASADSSVALAVASATTVTIDAGATTTSVDLDATVNSSLTTVNASASTGSVTMTIDADLAADGLTVTGGSGADLIDSSAGVLAKTDTIDGGDGIDTLRVQATADTGSATIAVDGATISNVEVLELEADNDAAAGTAADFTVDMDLIDGVTSIVLDSNDTEFASVFNLDDLSAAQAAAISVQGVAGTTNGTTVRLDLKDGSGTADTASVTASVKAGNTVIVGDENGNIESLTVAMNGSVDSTLSIDTGDFAGTASNPGSLTVTGGAAGKTLTVTSVSGGVVADTLDLTGVASDTAVTMGAANHTVKGSEGGDVIDFGANFNASDSVDGNGGTDVVRMAPASSFSGTATLTEVETLRMEATASVTARFAANADVATIDLDAGANSNSFVATVSGLTGITAISAAAEAGTTLDDANGLTVLSGFAGTADAAALNVTAVEDTMTVGALTLTGLETLNITATGDSNSYLSTVGGISATSGLKTVTVASSGYDALATDHDIALGTVGGNTTDAMETFTSTANVGVSVTLDSLATGAAVTFGTGGDDVSIVGSAGTGLNIVMGGGTDTLTLTTTSGHAISTGSGAATIVMGTGDNNSITLGTGANSIDFSAAGLATESTGNVISGFNSGDSIVADDDLDTAITIVSAQTATAVQTAAHTTIFTLNATTAGAVISGTDVVADFTDVSDGGDVEQFIEAAYATANHANGASFVLNDGTNSYIYAFVGTAAGNDEVASLALTATIENYVIDGGNDII